MTGFTIVSEEETGTYTGRLHPHNGYHAGDFGPDGTGAPAAAPRYRSVTRRARS